MPDTPTFISENGLYEMEPHTNDLTKISVNIHSIQVENTLHIMPSDEADLHALVEPCPCRPKCVWLSFPGPFGVSAIKLHRPLTEGEPT